MAGCHQGMLLFKNKSLQHSRSLKNYPSHLSLSKTYQENVRRINNPDKPKVVEQTGAAPAKSDPASPRARINAAKGIIPFLQEEDSKVLEFWQIWSESIPAKEDVPVGQAIDFIVAVSADMEKLTWRTAGPQNIFIQKMVDFFWNVGAPEPEIDRLNDVGALINPVKIGSRIDMSNKGGMDGGWYFPVEIPVQLAISAADAGEATRKVMEYVTPFLFHFPPSFCSHHCSFIFFCFVC